MQTFQENPRELDGVPDLCLLNHLQEPNVLHNLKYRYQEGKIYTSTTSKVLVAVNPYETVAGNDSDATMARYQRAPVNLEGLMTGDGLEPHVFTVAHAAYHNMCAKRANQSVVVCGESGSGKTESAKLFMKFLAYTSSFASISSESYFEASEVGKKILDANPILESFGNAQTVLNDNSSRFGKFTKMLFQPQNANLNLTGAIIETYLLEKSRVVRQDPGERNYHVFYLLLAAAAQYPDLGLGNGSTANFHYVKQSSLAKSDENNFNELVQAMTTLKFSKEEQADVFRLVAGILHLGNVSFEDGAKVETCVISNTEALQTVARLLRVDTEPLGTRLTTRTITLRNQTIVKPLTREAAESNRDSIAKALFNGLFLWIVERINKESSSPITEQTNWIGTLDVFGFEIFENNSFEQFCINFANERLQQFFNYNVLKMEQDLYRKEALIWVPINLPENQDVIDLISSRPHGILPILDSACLQPQGNDEVFMQNVMETNPRNPRMQKMSLHPTRKAGQQFAAFNGFVIKHYAGPVIYDAKEFLVKNIDSAHPDTISLFHNSGCYITSDILLLREGGDRMALSDVKGGQKFKSTSFVFNEQLVSLMTTLGQTTPYFVRCIKPNCEKTPQKFVSEYVLPQLRCGGLVEALRIIKCGFPTRCSYERMHSMFGSILEGFNTITNLNKRDFTEAMIFVCGDEKEQPARDEYQLGLTMIFFRPGKQAFFQKILALDPASITMQQRMDIHQFLIHKRIVRMRGAYRASVQLKRIYLFNKFQSMGKVMSIVHQTMFSSLNRVRKVVAVRREEDEKQRLAKDVQFQQGQKALEEVERLKLQEIRLQKAVDVEREKTRHSEEQLASFLTKIRTLNTELSTAQQEAAGQKSQLEQQIQEGLKKLQAAIAEKAAGQEDLSQAKRKVEELHATLEAAKSEMTEKAREGLQVRQSIEETVTKLNQSKEEAQQLATQLSAVNAAKAEVEERLQQMLATNQTATQGLEASIADKESSLQELEKTIQSLRTENTELAQLRITEAKAAQKRLEGTLQDSESELLALQKRMEEEIAELKQRLAAANNDKANLEKSLLELNAKCSRLEDEISRQSRDSAKSDELALSKIVGKDGEIAALQENYNKALQEARNTREEIQNLDFEHQNVVKQRAREIADWETKFQRFKTEAEESAAEAKKSMVKAHEQAIETIKAQLEATNKQLVKAQEKFSTDASKREELTSRELDTKNREIEEARTEATEVKARLSRAQAQISELAEKQRVVEQAKEVQSQEQAEESARLMRKMTGIASQLTTLQERNTSLEDQLSQARTTTTSTEEKNRRELAQLRANLDEEVRRATSVQDQSARQVQHLEHQLEEQAEKALKDVEDLKYEMKAKERKYQEESAEWSRKLASATRAQAGATAEEVAAWDRERTALVDKVNAEAEKGLSVSREVMQLTHALNVAKKALEEKERDVEEVKSIYERKFADQESSMKQMQRKFERNTEEAHSETQNTLAAAASKVKTMQLDLDSSFAREAAAKAELDTLRDELAAKTQQARTWEANSEIKIEALEKQYKLQARKNDLEWEKKLRACQNQVQEALDEARNSEKTHKIEVEGLEERMQEIRDNVARELAREKEAIASQLAFGSTYQLEIKQMEQTFHHRELNFHSQLEDLTRALLESKQMVRELTSKHEGLVADLTRERANMPIQLKVMKMEMATKADVAMYEHKRLLANAEAEIGILKTRLYHAPPVTMHFANSSTVTSTITVTKIPVETLIVSETPVVVDEPTETAPIEIRTELDTENEPPSDNLTFSSPISSPKVAYSPKKLELSVPESPQKVELTSPRRMTSPRRALKDKTKGQEVLTPSSRTVRI